MQVRVRDAKASCPCGSSEFVAPHAAPYASDDVFACAECGRRRPYGELLEQIGDEAIRRARGALDAMKRRPSQKQKRL
ncbi:MAG TPA: hypothetical protein VM489_02065 [Burkholderiales bacterium]|nr:hypothetical protein [Burkholderiales bacterium]